MDIGVIISESIRFTNASSVGCIERFDRLDNWTVKKSGWPWVVGTNESMISSVVAAVGFYKKQFIRFY